MAPKNKEDFARGDGGEFISGLVTAADLAAYRRDGAVCIRGVVPPGEIDAMRAASDHVIAIRAARGEAGAEGKSGASGPAFHNLLRVAKEEPAFHHALFHSAVPRVARDLMQSRKVIIFGDTLLVKEPGTRDRTPWHHDMPYWPVRGEQVCSAWIALDPVTKDNGGMAYVAGSHRWAKMFRPRYFDGAPSTDTRFEIIPDIDADIDSYSIVSWDMEPGDVLIHQGLTVHGAGENKRLDLNRRAYAPRYVGDSAWWDPEFNAGRGGPDTAKLAFGDPLDSYSVHPVAIDLNVGVGIDGHGRDGAWR